MKKIITFLFCTAVVSSAFSQTNSCNWKNKNINVEYYGNSNDHTNYGYRNIINQRDLEIQKVNDQNNWQVQ